MLINFLFVSLCSQVQVRDNYGGTLTHSVLLIIPELPPIFDSLKYTFNISEHTGPDMTEAIGVISVLDPNGDTCQGKPQNATL